MIQNYQHARFAGEFLHFDGEFPPISVPKLTPAAAAHLPASPAWNSAATRPRRGVFRRRAKC